jgi:hypothetical protein
MAKVKRNILVSGLSGSLGPDHYARITRDGRTIISAKPDFSNRQFSEAQLEHQSRMKQAAAYARVAAKANPIYANLAEGTAKNAYNIALGDWLNPPIIRSIDWFHDGLIRVHATDDVQVTKVVITVLDQEGQRLEQGEAELVLGVWWEYRIAKRGRIQVEAWDFAGNAARREFDDPSLFTPFPKKIT